MILGSGHICNPNDLVFLEENEVYSIADHLNPDENYEGIVCYSIGYGIGSWSTVQHPCRFTDHACAFTLAGHHHVGPRVRRQSSIPADPQFVNVRGCLSRFWSSRYAL
jgi:hypothetical protein